MSTDTPTPEQALESAQRFINHWFNNEGAKPQVRIPADTSDDDLRLTAFIKNAAEVERERDAARAELASAHRRIHGDESDECVFCNTKHRSPVSTGNQEYPQCHLCTIEADTEILRAERDEAQANAQAWKTSAEASDAIARDNFVLFKSTQDKLIKAQAEARDYKEGLQSVLTIAEDWGDTEIYEIIKRARAALAKYQPQTTTPE